MGTFNTQQILSGPVSLIPVIADRIQQDFRMEGYEVAADALSSGGYEISITKGGIFKAVLGMKTALKVTLTPQGDSIHFKAGVGIWGQQAIPTIISMAFFWPVLLTQLQGIVKQSKLDDKALEIAQEVIRTGTPAASSGAAGASKKFCTSCGTENNTSANFCCGCGKQF